jgi:hypothetical protein
MKNTFATISFLVLFFYGNAKVLTLSNDTHQPAMFMSFYDAYNAAQDGDTIYISGSTTSYGDMVLTKKLTLIGGGFQNPNEYLFRTTLGNITFT